MRKKKLSTRIRKLLPWRTRLVLVLGALMPLSCGPAWAQTNSSGEYELKAAFLFNFAKFIDWPPGSFAGPQSPFSICIPGADPFGHSIDDVLQGKMVGSHHVVIRRHQDPEPGQQCQIVFVSSAEMPHLADILADFQGASTLLVGDAQGFAAQGGDIEMTIEQDRVRFAINPDAAGRAGLKISSKLMALARIVHDESPSRGARG